MLATTFPGCNRCGSFQFNRSKVSVKVKVRVKVERRQQQESDRKHVSYHIGGAYPIDTSLKACAWIYMNSLAVDSSRLRLILIIP